MYDRKIAQTLLETGAVRLNVKEPFTFASGIKSPIYCDNRLLLGFPSEREMLLEAFLQEDFTKVDIIVGTATAGIPWASILADRLKKPLSYVRSSMKGHGKRQAIEGADVQGKRVLVIEDLISTGASSKKVVDILLEKEADVQGISAIFSYGFSESTESLGLLSCHTLSNFDTLLSVAKEKSYLTQEECELVLSWRNNPRKTVS